MTCNKSSVSLNKGESLFTSELITLTVTSKNNKAHKKYIKKLFRAVRLKEDIFNVLDGKAFRFTVCSNTASIKHWEMKQISRTHPHPQRLQSNTKKYSF